MRISSPRPATGALPLDPMGDFRRQSPYLDHPGGKSAVAPSYQKSLDC